LETMKQWHSSRHQAAGWHREPKGLTRGNYGSGRKLAVRKSNIIRDKWTRAKAEQGIRRVRTLR
jgi:hypothetical protein